MSDTGQSNNNTTNNQPAFSFGNIQLNLGAASFTMSTNTPAFVPTTQQAVPASTPLLATPTTVPSTPTDN